jgi:hypothetical protein
MFKQASVIFIIAITSIIIFPEISFAKSTSVSYTVTLTIPPRPIEDRFENIQSEKIFRNGEAVLVKTIVAD